MAENEIDAMKLAEGLEKTNRERRNLSTRIFNEAKEQIGKIPEGPSVLIAHDPEWPMGVVGLIAGKIMNEYHRPVFILGEFQGNIAGSGRSIEGFDCTEALDDAKDLLLKYGGHPRACGFTIVDNSKYEELKARFNDFAKKVLTKEDLIQKLDLDAELRIEDITWDFNDSLEKMRPFGMGNPAPLFLSKNVEVVESSTVGADNKHLRLALTHDGKVIRKAIAFRNGHWLEKLQSGAKIDIAYRVDVNEWNGNRELQLKIEEIKLS